MTAIELSSSFFSRLSVVAPPGGSELWKRVSAVRWPMFSPLDEAMLEEALDGVASQCVAAPGSVVILPDGKVFGAFEGATFRRH
jgi:hypothetical protein